MFGLGWVEAESVASCVHVGVVSWMHRSVWMLRSLNIRRRRDVVSWHLDVSIHVWDWAISYWVSRVCIMVEVILRDCEWIFRIKRSWIRSMRGLAWSLSTSLTLVYSLFGISFSCFVTLLSLFSFFLMFLLLFLFILDLDDLLFISGLFLRFSFLWVSR